MLAKAVFNRPGEYTELPPRSWLFYGEPKVGKTSLAADFPSPLLLNYEPENGTVEIPGATLPYTTADEVLRIVREFGSARHEYQTLVWDGFTNFVLGTVESLGAGERDPRRAHAKAAAEIMPAIAAFVGLRKFHRVITGHGRAETQLLDIPRAPSGVWNNVPHITMQPDLPPRVRLYLLGLLDSYGYAYKESGGGRRIRWHGIDAPVQVKAERKPNELKSLVAGSRLALPSVTELSIMAISVAVINGGKDAERKESRPSRGAGAPGAHPPVPRE